MNARVKAKIAVDILMTLTLMILMGYIYTGDLAHEIFGTLMIILWIVHNILNRRWYPATLKGKYSVRRVFNTVINGLLLVSVAGLIVSSIMLSYYVFGFLGIQGGTGFARVLHMISSYWCFVLTSLHLGLHWSRIVKMMHKGKGFSVKVRLPGQIVSLVLSVYGLFAFFKHQLPTYMFGRTIFVFFDFEQSPISFFFEYLGMMVFFATLSYYLSFYLSNKKTRSQLCSIQEKN